MGLEIITVGGFGEVGRNCTLVKADDESVLLDLGLHMDNYIAYSEESEDIPKKEMSSDSLIKVDAVPDINKIKSLWPTIKAICVSHAHLDHVGAVPFLSNNFDADIYASDYTIEVLKEILQNDGIKLKNKMYAKPVNSKFKVSSKISIEFISITHSVPQTVIIAVHTPYGVVVYANDFKLDNAPVLGDKPNLKRLEELGHEKVKALIVDSLYAHTLMKTPSESIAREMLKDVILGVNSKGKTIIVTTFASHIARLSTIVTLGIKLRRKIVFVGRSFTKYLGAAKRAGIADFSKQAEFIRYGGQVEKFFKSLKHPEKYMFIVTGHQGEPGAVLPRMVYKHLYDFKEGDNIIFSCSIIPVENNVINREKLDSELKKKRVRLFTDVHVSGHAFREDHRDLINMIKPEFVIPTHASRERQEAMKELAMEIGYKNDKIKILKNNEHVKF
jgi:ribonuclease J